MRIRPGGVSPGPRNRVATLRPSSRVAERGTESSPPIVIGDPETGLPSVTCRQFSQSREITPAPNFLASLTHIGLSHRQSVSQIVIRRGSCFGAAYEIQLRTCGPSRNASARRVHGERGPMDDEHLT